MPKPTRLVLVRHAESAPSAHVPDRNWPLTDKGRRQAQMLVGVLAPLRVQAVVSSPYLRAVETIRPFAEAFGLEILIEPDLREQLICTDWIDDLGSLTHIVHGDPHGRLRGGESAFEARSRLQSGLETIAASWPGQCVVVATHGAVIAHLMRHHHPDLPDGYHQRIGNPHLFHLDWQEPVAWVSELTLDGSAGVGLPPPVRR